MAELEKQMIRGSAALAVTRIVARTLGVASMLTVPRWLGPEEMGLFAVAALAVFTIELFTNSGLIPALIQKRTGYEQYLAPVRTFSAVRGALLCLIVFILAPHIAGMLNAPRAVPLLRWFSLSPLIYGLMPMVWVLAAKRLEFAKQAKYQIFTTAVAVFSTVLLAWILKSAWAIVWGTLISTAVGVIVSHLITAEGRAFSFRWGTLKDLHHFGFWTFMTGIFTYAYSRGGDWVIGRTLDVQILAVYMVALRIATLLTGEAAGIVTQMVFPVFASIQDQPDRLRSAFKKSFGLLALAAVLGGVLGCVLAPSYFTLALGTKWAHNRGLFLQLVPWLTLFGVCSAFAGGQFGVFQAVGRPRLWAITEAAMACLVAAGMYPITRWHGALGVAVLLGSISLVMQVVRMTLLARMLGLRLRESLFLIGLPLGLGAVAVATTKGVVGLCAAPPLLEMALSGALAVGLYLALICLFHSVISPDPFTYGLRLLGWLRRRFATPTSAKTLPARLVPELE